MPPLAALLACVCVMVLGAGSAVAQQAREPMATTEPEPLVQGPARRARPRINVRPRYPYRSFHTIYPPPYDVEFPGPNAKRECTSRLVTEHRPSGTVVVPRMHCWWVGG
jgi:hypothetical protein